MQLLEREDAEYGRLLSYGPLDEGIVGRVAIVATMQRGQSWEEIARTLPDAQYYTSPFGRTIEYVDISPDDYDETIVWHAPMATSLDPAARFQIATLAAAAPTKRFIAVGNPAQIGHGQGALPFRDLQRVWAGDLRPAIEPTMLYLASQNIKEAAHVGFSCGADLAATAAKHAATYGQQVSRGAFMEPTSVANRTLPRLAADFLSAGATMATYAAAADCEALNDVRRTTDELTHGQLGFALGLLRLSNLAIAHALSLNGFEERVETGLRTQTGNGNAMIARIAWGTASELATHERVLGIVDNLRNTFDSDRVEAIQLAGLHHALFQDMYLTTALTLHAAR